MRGRMAIPAGAGHAAKGYIPTSAPLEVDDPAEVLKVHYDSVFFMEVVVGGRRAASCRRVFGQTRHGPYAAVVSQTAMGETHAVVIRRYRDPPELRMRIRMLTDAFIESGADPGSGMVPIDPERIWSIVRDLLALDKGLIGTDVIILAIALADPYSVRLLTWDRALVENRRIIEYEREMRRKNLRRTRLLVTDTL